MSSCDIFPVLTDLPGRPFPFARSRIESVIFVKITESVRHFPLFLMPESQEKTSFVCKRAGEVFLYSGFEICGTIR